MKTTDYVYTLRTETVEDPVTMAVAFIGGDLTGFPITEAEIASLILDALSAREGMTVTAIREFKGSEPFEGVTDAAN
ncbi:hypothetical protein [Streptomyces sp. NRRL S-475]|uniref:hypothetical protein n=1 Tax=Streptomyces sp. NRRL S-475 TaxID=1463910 RepID=UPI0004C8CB04|nr:hypothetical protein [Streptomyces sp. NRRL S-475]